MYLPVVLLEGKGKRANYCRLIVVPSQVILRSFQVLIYLRGFSLLLGTTLSLSQISTPPNQKHGHGSL